MACYFQDRFCKFLRTDYPPKQQPCSLVDYDITNGIVLLGGGVRGHNCFGPVVMQFCFVVRTHFGVWLFSCTVSILLYLEKIVESQGKNKFYIHRSSTLPFRRGPLHWSRMRREMNLLCCAVCGGGGHRIDGTQPFEACMISSLAVAFEGVDDS